MKFGFEIAAALVIAGMTIPTAEGHEFWIDGRVTEQNGTSQLALYLKVGQMLDGISLPYIPETVECFKWVHGGTGELVGEIGESPVAHVPIDPSEGAVIFHRTAPRQLVHRDWAKFLEYLAVEGLGDIAEAHDSRGLPRIGFAEMYTRHAKFALVGSNREVIGDRYLGSPLEIVLERMMVEAGGSVRITGQIVDGDGPTARQISIFRASPNGIVVRRIMSGSDGRFAITLAGKGPVLMNTVKISPILREDTVWHSDWASFFLNWR